MTKYILVPVSRPVSKLPHPDAGPQRSVLHPSGASHQTTYSLSTPLPAATRFPCSPGARPGRGTEAFVSNASSLSARTSLGAPVTFAPLSRASFMSHLLAPPPCRAGPSPSLALWYGMVSQWFSGHFQEYSPSNSFSNLKQHYFAVLGLEMLLSSPT